MKLSRYTDLHITKSIYTMRMQTKHRSRQGLHQEHFLSQSHGFWFVMAPHQPHLKIGALEGRRRRKPQPQHVASRSSLTVVIRWSYYKTLPLATKLCDYNCNAQKDHLTCCVCDNWSRTNMFTMSSWDGYKDHKFWCYVTDK